MAYQTGTATSQEDLITQLFTFATGNGWTQDELDLANNRGSLSNGGVFVHFRWDGTESGGADNIAMTQSLGFAGTGLAIDAHTNDSGNGQDGPDLSSERRVSGIGNGPFTSYDFFLGTSPNYLYVVLEYAPGLYRHFGFGNIVKIGDWTGGEFCGGHVWEEDGVSDDDPDGTRHTILCDGLHTSTSGVEELEPATLHVEGLPSQPGSPGRWANVGNGNNSDWRDVDGNGEDRAAVTGGIRGGYWIRHFGWTTANLLNGFVPLIPVPMVYEVIGTSPTQYILLGFLPDVRHVQMKFFSPGQTVTVGSDTWHIFPGVRKRNQQDNQSETRNMGIAYKQVP